jgi:hypothetical protein
MSSVHLPTVFESSCENPELRAVGDSGSSEVSTPFVVQHAESRL